MNKAYLNIFDIIVIASLHAIAINNYINRIVNKILKNLVTKKKQ